MADPNIIAEQLKGHGSSRSSSKRVGGFNRAAALGSSEGELENLVLEQVQRLLVAVNQRGFGGESSHLQRGRSASLGGEEFRCNTGDQSEGFFTINEIAKFLRGIKSSINKCKMSDSSSENTSGRSSVSEEFNSDFIEEVSVVLEKLRHKVKKSKSQPHIIKAVETAQDKQEGKELVNLIDKLQTSLDVVLKDGSKVSDKRSDLDNQSQLYIDDIDADDEGESDEDCEDKNMNNVGSEEEDNAETVHFSLKRKVNQNGTNNKFKSSSSESDYCSSGSPGNKNFEKGPNDRSSRLSKSGSSFDSPACLQHQSSREEARSFLSSAIVRCKSREEMVRQHTFDQSDEHENLEVVDSSEYSSKESSEHSKKKDIKDLPWKIRAVKKRIELSQRDEYNTKDNIGKKHIIMPSYSAPVSKPVTNSRPRPYKSTSSLHSKSASSLSNLENWTSEFQRVKNTSNQPFHSKSSDNVYERLLEGTQSSFNAASTEEPETKGSDESEESEEEGEVFSVKQVFQIKPTEKPPEMGKKEECQIENEIQTTSIGVKQPSPISSVFNKGLEESKKIVKRVQHVGNLEVKKKSALFDKKVEDKVPEEKIKKFPFIKKPSVQFNPTFTSEQKPISFSVPQRRPCTLNLRDFNPLNTPDERSKKMESKSEQRKLTYSKVSFSPIKTGTLAPCKSQENLNDDTTLSPNKMNSLSRSRSSPSLSKHAGFPSKAVVTLNQPQISTEPSKVVKLCFTSRNKGVHTHMVSQIQNKFESQLQEEKRDKIAYPVPWKPSQSKVSNPNFETNNQAHLENDPSKLLFTPEQLVKIAIHKAAINKQLDEQEKQRKNVFTRTQSVCSQKEISKASFRRIHSVDNPAVINKGGETFTNVENKYIIHNINSDTDTAPTYSKDAVTYYDTTSVNSDIQQNLLGNLSQQDESHKQNSQISFNEYNIQRESYHQSLEEQQARLRLEQLRLEQQLLEKQLAEHEQKRLKQQPFNHSFNDQSNIDKQGLNYEEKGILNQDQIFLDQQKHQQDCLEEQKLGQLKLQEKIAEEKRLENIKLQNIRIQEQKRIEDQRMQQLAEQKYIEDQRKQQIAERKRIEDQRMQELAQQKRIEEERLEHVRAQQLADQKRLEEERLEHLRAQQLAEQKRLEAERLEHLRAQRLAEQKRLEEAKLEKLRAQEHAEQKRLEEKRLEFLRAQQLAEKKRMEEEQVKHLKVQQISEKKRVEEERLQQKKFAEQNHLEQKVAEQRKLELQKQNPSSAKSLEETSSINEVLQHNLHQQKIVQEMLKKEKDDSSASIPGQLFHILPEHSNLSQGNSPMLKNVKQGSIEDAANVVFSAITRHLSREDLAKRSHSLSGRMGSQGSAGYCQSPELDQEIYDEVFCDENTTQYFSNKGSVSQDSLQRNLQSPELQSNNKDSFFSLKNGNKRKSTSITTLSDKYSDSTPNWESSKTFSKITFAPENRNIARVKSSSVSTLSEHKQQPFPSEKISAPFKNKKSNHQVPKNNSTVQKWTSVPDGVNKHHYDSSINDKSIIQNVNSNSSQALNHAYSTPPLPSFNSVSQENISKTSPKLKFKEFIVPPLPTSAHKIAAAAAAAKQNLPFPSNTSKSKQGPSKSGSLDVIVEKNNEGISEKKGKLGKLWESSIKGSVSYSKVGVPSTSKPWIGSTATEVVGQYVKRNKDKLLSNVNCSDSNDQNLPEQKNKVSVKKVSVNKQRNQSKSNDAAPWNGIKNHKLKVSNSNKKVKLKNNSPNSNTVFDKGKSLLAHRKNKENNSKISSKWGTNSSSTASLSSKPWSKATILEFAGQFVQKNKEKLLKIDNTVNDSVEEKKNNDSERSDFLKAKAKQWEEKAQVLENATRKVDFFSEKETSLKNRQEKKKIWEEDVVPTIDLCKEDRVKRLSINKKQLWNEADSEMQSPTSPKFDNVKRMSNTQALLWEKGLEKEQEIEKIPWTDSVSNKIVKKEKSKFEELSSPVSTPETVVVRRSNSNVLSNSIFTAFEEEKVNHNKEPISSNTPVLSPGSERIKKGLTLFEQSISMSPSNESPVPIRSSKSCIFQKGFSSKNSFQSIHTPDPQPKVFQNRQQLTGSNAENFSKLKNVLLSREAPEVQIRPRTSHINIKPRPQSLCFYPVVPKGQSLSTSQLLPWGNDPTKRSESLPQKMVLHGGQYEASMAKDVLQEKTAAVESFFFQPAFESTKVYNKSPIFQHRPLSPDSDDESSGESSPSGSRESWDDLLSGDDIDHHMVDKMFAETLNDLDINADLSPTSESGRRRSLSDLPKDSIDHYLSEASRITNIKRSKTVKGNFGGNNGKAVSFSVGICNKTSNSAVGTSVTSYKAVDYSAAVKPEISRINYCNQSNVIDGKGNSPFDKFKQLDSQYPKQTTSGSGIPSGPLFQLSTSLNRSASGVKDMILTWCQCRTRGYKGVTIENFSTSWNDGLAFCALIHHFFPDSFDFNSLDPKNRRHNFALAFRVADEKAGVYPLLDVDDMVMMKKPDWKSVFTYVQSLYKRLKDE